MSDLEAAVRSALDLRPLDAQSAITAAVADQLRRTDPQMRIDDTGYFNHTYIPDLVVSWPGSDGRNVRPYYLRLQLDEQQSAEDVARLGGDSPAIIGLLPAADRPKAGRGAIVADSPTTLVAEASAIEDLEESRGGDAFAALIPPAVLRAGRGYLDEGGAAELAEAAQGGFSAAARADADATRSALTTLHRHLADGQAVELERTLGVVWLGSGADRDDFPAGVDLDSSPLPGTLRGTLNVLFSQPAIEQEGFWARVASWMNEDDLLSFGELDSSPNLELLMAHASSRLRFVSVAVTEPRSDAVSGIWSVANNGLLFSSGDTALHFVTDGRSHSHWPETHEPPDWETLKQRVLGLPVERAQFDSGTVSVRVDAKRGTSGKEQAEVMSSIQEMSGLGRVREIVVRTSEGDGVRCRMACQVATAERSKRVTAAELGWIAASVVAGVGEGSLDQIRRALYGAAEPGDLA